MTRILATAIVPIEIRANNLSTAKQAAADMARTTVFPDVSAWSTSGHYHYRQRKGAIKVVFPRGGK